MQHSPLLRAVSRSFYLSIRLLPGALRAPVGLAYLLARATDTIADTVAAPAGQRRVLLSQVGDAIATGKATVEADFSSFVAMQGDPVERELIERLDECLASVLRLDAADQHDIRTVLAHIVRGQTLDIERPALPDAASLHEYTYLVAGSVGEFWTDICARHVPDFATKPHAEMRALGRAFGCALQLVNIVRDAGDDLRAGRCYVPTGELERWREVAASGLDAGMAYALAVNSRRIRAAVALPALIGRDTLTRLHEAGPRALEERVKVPRHEVRALLLRIALGLAGRKTLQREWDNRAR
jgi:farnesyl-diphosphate farnesyltransferase